MKLSKLTMLSAAALLAGGMSIAAQPKITWRPGSIGQQRDAKPQGQCWDAASNTVKDKPDRRAARRPQVP